MIQVIERCMLLLEVIYSGYFIVVILLVAAHLFGWISFLLTQMTTLF